MIGGETLAENAIQALYARIAESNFTEGHGGLQTLDVTGDYIERITTMCRSTATQGRGGLRQRRAGRHRAAGARRHRRGSAAAVLRRGRTFPITTPIRPTCTTCRDLIMTVKQVDADLGLAFDGDGDRLGVVTRAARVIFPDRTLMLFAIDVLTRNPGATIIYDVKCTGICSR
jgi:phosphomannomutase/phosphoglucomutase